MPSTQRQKHKITLETIIDKDIGLTLGDMIHLEVENTLSKLGFLKTYSKEEADEILNIK